MTFKEIFSEKYGRAHAAAVAGDEQGVIGALEELVQALAEQYEKKNNDTLRQKAQLSFWQERCDAVRARVAVYGLQDAQVSKFFGLQPEPARPAPGGLGLDGLVDPDYDAWKRANKDAEGAREEKPFTPPEEIPPIPAMQPAGNGANERGGEEQPEGGQAEDKQPSPEQPEGGQAEDKQPSPEQPAPEEPEDKQPAAEEPEDKQPAAEQPADDRRARERRAPSRLSMEPQDLREFIGQEHIVVPMLKEIAIAVAQGRRYLDNILLFGNPGLGKTTLMRLIAKAMRVNLEILDCSQCHNNLQSLKALQQFLMNISRKNEPVVIAFDEVHMLGEQLQSSLLTLLNDRIYISPPDRNGNVKTIPMPEFTFIAATTDDDKVLPTIKNRCLRLTFQLVEYKPEELRLIYQNKVASKGLTITQEAIDACIPRSRGAIRYVNAIVDGLDNALYDDNGHRISTNIDLAVAEQYFKDKGIDPIGLTPKELEILRVIGESSTGYIGEEALASRVGLTVQKYNSEYKPYLIKIGFVEIVRGSGHHLTEKAMEYLKLK